MKISFSHITQHIYRWSNGGATAYIIGEPRKVWVTVFYREGRMPLATSIHNSFSGAHADAVRLIRGWHRDQRFKRCGHLRSERCDCLEKL